MVLSWLNTIYNFVVAASFMVENNLVLSDLGMEAIRNLKLVEAARNEAKKVIEQDLVLSKHKLIAKKIAVLEKNLHLE
jgi:hypothetical protein